MTTEKLTFDIVPSNSAMPIGCAVWVNTKCVFDQDTVTESAAVSIDFDDDIEATHQIKIQIKNKNHSHTVVDAEGQIVSDSVLQIKNFTVAQINIDSVIMTHAIYQHNFNGTAPDIADKFFMTCGCNGTVSFEFSTPAYLWLLEHM